MEGGAIRHTPPSRVEQPQDDRPVAVSPPPPGNQNRKTYIVQAPKDQVYRVPPLENALIVENYRNPRSVENFSCSFCFGKVAIALLAILVLVSITLAILFFVFKPTPPLFSVKNLIVKNPKYEISLSTKNPNAKYELEYDNDDQVSLLFDDKKVGTGKFPHLHQQPSSSSKVKVEVAGSNETLPAQMENSINSKNPKIPISLYLEMDLGVRMRGESWLNSWIFNSHVASKFKVNTLRNQSRVLSQHCNSDFGR
ncbi:hypothetical protein L6164_012370 [Bauhinia variegata]|uniref:Uncharacterized protein n=1 Tax=Bauhinia variegata TaxID=167791 RepID=A0ACB9P9W7_BAUVA|nr:hypothetical protein L6164_012370 [Bauhinia variegata]